MNERMEKKMNLKKRCKVKIKRYEKKVYLKMLIKDKCKEEKTEI